MMDGWGRAGVSEVLNEFGTNAPEIIYLNTHVSDCMCASNARERARRVLRGPRKEPFAAIHGRSSRSSSIIRPVN